MVLKLPIARGMIYHSIFDDVVNFIKSFFVNLNNKKIIEKFEESFAKNLGLQYGIAFPFARMGIYYSLKAQNLPYGSEIIVPPITIKPIIDVIIMLGLKPVFVDIELDTLCFDIKKLKNAINSNTSAVLITYLFGITPNIIEITDILRNKKLFIIEDISHNLNASYNGKKLGSFGDVSVYSSSSMKTVDAYGGGIVCTNNNSIAEKLIECKNNLKKTPRKILRKKIFLDLIRNVFSNRLVFSFFTFPLLNIIRKFNKNLFKSLLGAHLKYDVITDLPEEWTHSFTSFQAKIGIKYLKKVIKRDELCRKNVEFLIDNLKKKSINNYPKLLDNSVNVYWQFPIYVEDFDDFFIHFSKNGIDTGTTNLELCSTLDLFKEYNTDTPNAEFIKYHGAFIPIYSKLKTGGIKHISSVIEEYYKDKNKKNNLYY